ncbi:hypothetical protein K435DRAFT_464730 [Dendrothele bispora CBS 962.96]|uniref:Uncharacterized protein n=1 Tax=Dendrothele bispora (strain CBS 962.96) TaxID=1314807 RepID=A0A4S8L0S5_DENBC|nr:hypothetical protein K435DRAFT_464730 [Dendrothele bispora CBS 962.96]
MGVNFGQSPFPTLPKMLVLYIAFPPPRLPLHHLCFYNNTTSNVTRARRYMELVHKTGFGKGAGMGGSGHKGVMNISFFVLFGMSSLIFSSISDPHLFRSRPSSRFGRLPFPSCL